MEPLTAGQPCDRRRWTRLPSHPCTPLSACCLTTPLEFKQQRICPLSLGFGTLGRSPSSSSPRQKTIAPRLHVCHFPRLPCALPCPAPCISSRPRDIPRKLFQDELEALLFALPSSCRPEARPEPDLHRRKMHLVFNLMPSPPLHSQKPPREHRTGKQVPMQLPFQRKPQSASTHRHPSSLELPSALPRPTCLPRLSGRAVATR